MSPTVISSYAIIAAQVLPIIGITVGSDALTTTVQTVITLVAGLVILVRRLLKGDVTIFGKVTY